MTAEPAPLPPLREDVVLVQGAPDTGGWPTYVLVDPVRNRYFRLGWLEVEMLARWPAGNVEALLARLAAETTLHAGPDDVEALVRTLATNHLLAGVPPEKLLEIRKAGRVGWLTWLVHHYLFIRIPLVRPDRFLGRTLPAIDWMWSRTFLAAMAAVAVLALVLAARQWETFLATFPYTFGPWGAVGWLAALAVAKVVHELGHAYTLKRAGGRVPTMGVALLVMWPVLYTDTSAAWTLRSRRSRLAVAAAGVVAETMVAALALLAWSFLPSGTARTACFLLATGSLITTLAVNLSPLMRFDGYYLLSDGLGVPNLQERAFALARWQLRRTLLGWDDPPDEDHPRARARAMLAYAYGAWIYRLGLFLGIAVMVYAMFFKLLGVVLFAVEIWWFVAKPIVGEAMHWWHERGRLRANRRLLATLAVAGLGVVFVLAPGSARIEAPGLARPAPRALVYPPYPGRVVEVHAHEGDAVAAGQPLVVLDAPDVALEVASANAELAEARWRADRFGLSDRLRTRAQVLERELAAAQARGRGAGALSAQQVVTAPVAGTVRDLPVGLAPGLWVGREDRLAVVAGADWEAVAYAAEADVGDLVVGASARFIPESPAMASVPLRLATIDPAAAHGLDAPWLASTQGGAIAAREPRPGGAPVPQDAVYRIVLHPVGAVDLPPQALRGRV
ncbi:MAG: HlyD family efflux transporter periplasmic adaptor subunit, partial [Actinomycetota bacterium]